MEKVENLNQATNSTLKEIQGNLNYSREALRNFQNTMLYFKGAESSRLEDVQNNLSSSLGNGESEQKIKNGEIHGKKDKMSSHMKNFETSIKISNNHGFSPAEEKKIGEILSDSDSEMHKEDRTPKAKTQGDPELLRF